MGQPEHPHQRGDAPVPRRARGLADGDPATRHASDLNPTEGAWSHLKRDLGNLVACTIDQLAAAVKTLLKRIQYRPELIDGFLAQTGLTLDPEPP